MSCWGLCLCALFWATKIEHLASWIQNKKAQRAPPIEIVETSGLHFEGSCSFLADAPVRHEAAPITMPVNADVLEIWRAVLRVDDL